LVALIPDHDGKRQREEGQEQRQRSGATKYQHEYNLAEQIWPPKTTQQHPVKIITEVCVDQ
jgi:hypothetical protein